MAKYNIRTPAVVTIPAKPAKSVIGTKASGKTAKTYEGHDGFERTTKSALFLLAAGSLGGEDKFYETGAESTKRLVELARKVAVKDAEWIAEFIKWLRSEGNIRTASVVAAIEAADAMVKAGIPGGRQIVASVLQRADEPGEAMAYWLATRGRKVLMPKAIKRGIADAAARLYTEFSFLKYDSDRAAVRFGDVIEMTHPDPLGTFWKKDLFRFAIEKRHGRDTQPAESLSMIRRQAEWFRNARADKPDLGGLLDPEILRGAGITWEDALSALGSKVDKGKLWKAMLPQLGYMALIRNLRNLDDHGVSDKDVAPAIARIQDPEQVAKSRQLPYRFYSAYKEAPSLRWGHALELALGLSLKNIPALGGRTLILVDTSASMTDASLSAKSKMTYEQIAALFGIALAMKGESDLYMWADSPMLFPVTGTSVLKNLEEFGRKNGLVGHGTNLAAAIQGSYVPGKYSRMVVISDMQVMMYGRGTIPTDIPCYFFNLKGYRAAAVQTKGLIYELGGLSDSTFRMIPMLEAGESGQWPWSLEESSSV